MANESTDPVSFALADFVIHKSPPSLDYAGTCQVTAAKFDLQGALYQLDGKDWFRFEELQFMKRAVDYELLQALVNHQERYPIESDDDEDPTAHWALRRR